MNNNNVKGYVYNGNTVTTLDALFDNNGKSKQKDVYELYEAVAIIFRAVNIRAKSVMSLPYTITRIDADGVTDDDTDLKDTPEVKALLPHPVQTLWRTEAALCLWAQSYLIRETNRRGTMERWRWTTPLGMTPEIDECEGLLYFERNTGKKMYKWPTDDTAWTWFATLDADIGPGVAPAQAACAAANIVYNANELIGQFFERGAIKPVVLFVDESGGNAITAEQKKKVEQRWNQFMYQLRAGIRQAWESIIFNRRVTMETVGADMAEADVGNITNDKMKEALIAMEVPFSLVFSDAANLATRQRDTLDFYNQVVIPDAELISETWNEKIFTPREMVWAWHPEKMEIYQEAQLAQVQAVTTAVGVPVLTVDEGRALLGYDPLDAPPPTPEPDDTADMMDGTADETTEDAQPTVDEEMRTWERFALRRVREGKPQKAATFTSAVLPPALRGAIAGQLRECKTAEDVRRVFVDAGNWGVYP